ncbi:MAG: FapA family protein, partial [Aeromonas veronii]
TRLQILGGYFTHKEQELQLKVRQQECLAQLDKIKTLAVKLLQLPDDKRNPDTLRKLKPIRDHHLAELTLIHEQITANHHEMQSLMAHMEVIATQHLFSGIEVEMACFKRKVTITRGPTRLTIHDEQLEMTPYEGHS